MKPYNHFTLQERECLHIALKENKSLRQIAKELNKNVSSVSREIKRNSNKDGSYHPWACTVRYIVRRKKCRKHFRLVVDIKLISWVTQCLEKYWSPEIIVAKWKEDHNNRPLSHSTIYRAIKINLLPNITAKTHLRRRGKRKVSKRDRFNTIKPVHKIHERPSIINERARIGDLEGDTVCGAVGKGALVTLVDRKSRYLLASISKSKFSDEVANAIYEATKEFNVQSITFDNGPEFAGFKQIEEQLKAPIYFADPHSPWQRPTNENTNGLLRFFFPKGTDFTSISREYLQHVVDLINDRPRKCLSWLSPRDFLSKCCT